MKSLIGRLGDTVLVAFRFSAGRKDDGERPLLRDRNPSG